MISAAKASNLPAHLTPLPQSCNPHQPPLSPNLQRAHGNHNPVNAAHIYIISSHIRYHIFLE